MTNWSSLRKTKFPNVFETPTGGHLVRARVVDPTTDKLITIKKTLQLDPANAFQWLQAEIQRVKSGKPLPPVQKLRFSEFAATLFDEKQKLGDLRSAKTRERWGYTLEHLIVGTTGEKSGIDVPGFGDMFIDKIHSSHVTAWKVGVCGLIRAGDYSPTTTNGWLSILRIIDKAAKRALSLTGLFTDGVSDFDTSEHVTYTDEEPNALTPAQVPQFLELVRALYPQHYGMAFLGFATGLRPSSLRPLRRRGPDADVLWDGNRIKVRRSEVLGETMNTTKQKRRYPIDLPQAVMDVLKWHVETQLTPEQEDSDLLFPSITGGCRAACVLNKPFDDVSERLGFPRLTQRGMRRAFNDLARSAGVEALVTKSISGHQTDNMVELYSSVAPEEQRSSIAKVIRLFSEGGPLAGTQGADRLFSLEGG